MSAWLEVCLKDVKDQVLLRLDEIGGVCENLKTKVDVLTRLHAHDSLQMLVQVSGLVIWFCVVSKNELTLVPQQSQADTSGTINVDNVSGNEKDEDSGRGTRC